MDSTLRIHRDEYIAQRRLFASTLGMDRGVETASAIGMNKVDYIPIIMGMYRGTCIASAMHMDKGVI